MNSQREFTARKKRLAKWLSKNEFQIAVFLKEEIEFANSNFVYYGGAETSGEYSAIIVDSKANSYAIAHEYSYERVNASKMYDKVYEIRQSIDELVSDVKKIVQERVSGGKRIAFDLGYTTARTLSLLKQSGLNAIENNLTDFVYSERAIKSPYEIDQINNAIGIAKRAFEKTLSSLREGQSVSDVVNLVNQNLIVEGAAAPSFETDVRMRRGLSEEEIQKLRKGDLILFDFGARLPSMYPSDVGRTVPFGIPTGETKDFLGDVINIKKEGVKAIRNGKTGNEVRAEIDELIEEYGYVSTHRPGHQIGINVHEPYEPNLAYGKENNLKLKSGNVVTWEPGIGLRKSSGHTNRFGMAHMEDMMLVGENSKFLGNFDLQYW